MNFWNPWQLNNNRLAPQSKILPVTSTLHGEISRWYSKSMIKMELVDYLYHVEVSLNPVLDSIRR